MLAERYGGFGIGDNGGGVRCGNVDSFQIKGIGTNQLVGSGANFMHSYGGLNLVDAVHEAVSTMIFENVLPVGVAKVFGIILLGKRCAYSNPDNNSSKPVEEFGALLIRESTDRSGHLLRAAQFDVKPEFSHIMCSDVERIRSLYRALASESDFINSIGRFLSGCANQIAFAHAVRVSHGNISPSNLCFDGKWVDLTRTSCDVDSCLYRSARW